MSACLRLRVIVDVSVCCVFHGRVTCALRSPSLPNLIYARFVISCFACSLSAVVEYAAVNFMVYHSDKRFHSVGMGVDEYFRNTVPILWLLILLLSLFYINLVGARIAMVVLVLVWLTVFAVQVLALVRNAFYKPEQE